MELLERYLRWAEYQFPKISRSSFPEPENVTLNHKRDFRDAVSDNASEEEMVLSYHICL